MIGNGSEELGRTLFSDEGKTVSQDGGVAERDSGESYGDAC